MITLDCSGSKVVSAVDVKWKYNVTTFHVVINVTTYHIVPGRKYCYYMSSHLDLVTCRIVPSTENVCY